MKNIGSRGKEARLDRSQQMDQETDPPEWYRSRNPPQ